MVKAFIVAYSVELTVEAFARDARLFFKALFALFACFVVFFNAFAYEKAFYPYLRIVAFVA